MALKDWKVLGFKSKESITYYKKRSLATTILLSKEKNEWKVYTDRINYKPFKTKSQALKFAKSYMRKH